MNTWTLFKIELKKLHRSHIFWLLLAPVVILWIPSILNADFVFQTSSISPADNFFIQGYMGFVWFMFPASLIICTVLLTQNERSHNGILKMLSLPVSPIKLCLAKFGILLLLGGVQLLFMAAFYFPASLLVENIHNCHMVLEPTLVLKESFLIYLSSIPMAALYWFLSVYLRFPVLSMGLGLASIVPSVLAINTKIWFAYPMCYPFYVVMALRGTMEKSFEGFQVELLPWIPVALFVTFGFVALSCLSFGRKERK